MTWLPGTAELSPIAYERFRELYDGLWDGGVDATTLELCRDRVTALLRVEPDPIDWSGLTGEQRAAVAFTEQFVLDPHGLRDADFEALQVHMTSPAIATLVLAVAMFEARARFERALGVR